MKYLFIAFVVIVASVAVGAPPERLTTQERKQLEAKWKELMGAGSKHAGMGNPVKAQETFEKALETARQLYPASDFPSGHPLLAASLYTLGSALAGSEKNDEEAEALLSDAIKMTDGLYEKDHENKILGRMSLAQLLHRQGNLAEARQHYRNALELAERVYDKDHPETAAIMSSLGSLLVDQGDLYAAELLLTTATAMYRRLFPKPKFPKGAPPLAATLSNLGQLLAKEGKLIQSEEVLRESLEMFDGLFKQDSIYRVNVLDTLAAILSAQHKHHESELLFKEALNILDRIGARDSLANSHCLNNLAALYLDQQRFQEAESIYREVVRIRTGLLKADDFRVALCQNNLGTALCEQGNYAEAARCYQVALEMQNRLAKEGHPDAALTLQNLAFLRWREGKHSEAETHYRECLQMTRRLVTAYAREKSEGEALTLVASMPDRFSRFLSNALVSHQSSAVTYSELWSHKASVTRVFEQRQLAARTALNNEAALIVANLSTRRRRRGELLLAPQSSNTGMREKRVEELRVNAVEISKLESDLRRLFPAKEADDELATLSPKDLQKAISPDTAVVDFLRFTLFEQDALQPGRKGGKWTDHYIAFVITKEKISQVILGPAEPIESMVALWRDGIRLGKEIPAELPAKVRELMWAKVRMEIPKHVNVVYLVPDMALCRIPWAALPGDAPNSILLEDYAIAVVPHAVFLLGKLLPQAPAPKRSSGVLVLGGADYDVVEQITNQYTSLRRELPIKSDQIVRWNSLPATAVEARGVADTAARQGIPSQILGGREATTSAVLAALPKVRYAHLATHGFFAAPSFRSAFQMDSKLFVMTQSGERIGEGALSPLVMTGLVFAGANNPKTPARGVATGESFIDLDLSGLELAILSACETGLGDVAGGEGTFGLQRAFHLAGTRNVIASLWKVSDQGTCALMAVFYRKLWDRDPSLPPIEALRQAQLEIYRNPGKIPELANGFRGTFQVAKGQEVEEETLKPDLNGKAHPRYWAAFTLSGPGR